MAIIKTVVGDITTATENYICHQVNCKAKMNSGVAKAIREKWPIVYAEYLKMPGTLGDIQFVPISDNQTIINMFAQGGYGYDGSRYTDYEAFATCLETMDKALHNDATIAFPYRISCDRGGANWNIIKEMIREFLGAQTNRTIVFYSIKEIPNDF